ARAPREGGAGRRPRLGARQVADGRAGHRDLADRRTGAGECVRDSDPAGARHLRRRLTGEDGTAVVEFVLVSVLVVTVLLGVLQLTLALHVRNTVVDAAGEGARYGALAGVSAEAGAAPAPAPGTARPPHPARAGAAARAR